MCSNNYTSQVGYNIKQNENQLPVGHMFVLQACETDASPMHVPPFASTTVLVRVLICVPPPQLCEHELNELQSPQVQSTIDIIALEKIC